MNLANVIEQHPGDHVALVCQGRPLTYGALRAEVAAMRGALVGLGVTPGERVAIVCGNGPGFVVAYLATLGIGAVAVPLNPASPGPELATQAAAVEAGVVLVAPTAAAAWAAVPAADVPSVRLVVAVDGASVPGALDGDELRDHAPAPIVERAADDLAVLVFTSGTAGAPRAAMLSHGNLLANIAQAQSNSVRIEAADVVYCVLPLHHIFGLNVVLGISLAVGASVVLVQRFDPDTAIETIRERGVTIVPGAPPMWVAWAGLDTPADSFAGIRLALSGAAKLPDEAARLMRERFGVVVNEGYGLTEAGPSVTSSAGLPLRPGSIGKVFAGMEVRLVDESGDDVLAGDPGELWVKGPNVFHGYWQDADATARALTRDGWLRTGDVAIADADGYLFLVDRAKDLIIVSGFNVYPAEVEEVLAEHPGVREVAVVGVPHPHHGEAIRAYVVADPAARLDEDQLIEHCGEYLARYKCPAKVLFVEELPRGLSGKLLRRELHAERS